MVALQNHLHLHQLNVLVVVAGSGCDFPVKEGKKEWEEVPPMVILKEVCHDDQHI